MVLSQLSKQTNLRENRLRCIRTHLEAFDIEPVLQISLFEEVIMEVEGSCNVKCSCKVERDRLFACQFTLAYSQQKWPKTLKYNAILFDKIKSQVGICIDSSKFEQFSRLHVNSDKILDSTVGIDLRPKSQDSCIRISVHLEPKESPEELVRTALALDNATYTSELTQVFLQDCTAIIFECFFDGRSRIELGAVAPGKKHGFSGNHGRALTAYAQKYFSPKAVSLSEVSDLFGMTISKYKAEPVLHFGFNNIKDISNYFLFNTLGNRIYSFCQNQDCILLAIIGVNEKELYSNRLENFLFDYAKNDESRMMRV
uniref:TruF2 n=1 Tax=uncultured Prochloron sp. 06037A TaxID=503010 RepID=B2KYH1_9PROC|nr:TruF2 [uncultured Prochloron sp. 06037A]